MAEYSVDAVREEADRHARVFDEVPMRMLNAYADLLERIKADEVAVPVAQLRLRLDRWDVVGIHGAIEKLHLPAGEYPLFVRPPAQATQVAPDVWRDAAADVLGKSSNLYRMLCQQAEEYARRESAPTAEPVAQVDPGWPAPFKVVQTWALANGYSGATDAEACKAYREAHPAEPVAQGEATRCSDYPICSQAICQCDPNNNLDANAYSVAAGVMGTCPNGPTDESLRRAIRAYLAAQPRALPAERVVDDRALVPKRILIEAGTWDALQYVFGGPGTGDGEEFMDCTAWVGEIENDDGTKTYGMHVRCNECPEEGSVTLAEFAAAPQPGESQS